MAHDPSTVIPAVKAMQEDWAIVDALMGGTKAMRAAGETFLPKWPKETAESYKDRLNLSTLLPAYSETVHNMNGRVFAEPIVLGDDVPGQIHELADNIDRQGNNLQVWAQTLFISGLSHGLCHVLVDYPATAGLRTRADEQKAGVRPYAIMIRPEQVLGWKSATVGGEQMLSQFRYMELVEVDDPDNEFATKHEKQIRVLEPGAWRIYRQSDDGKGGKVWALLDEGTTTLPYIPLATFYTKRTGFMTATPPLMELAHLNIKHWQSQSDQDNILHVARVPMLVRTGVSQSFDGNGQPVVQEIQVGGCLNDLPENGDLKYVEHTGKAIEAGRQSLQDLVDDMRIAGAKLLHKEKQATKTATQAEEEAAQEMSPLETMAGQLEDAIDQVFQFFADWLSLGDGGNVQVNGNFEVDFDPQSSLPFLQYLHTNRVMSDETLFSEGKRRGIISDEVEWEAERDRIDQQGPALGTIRNANSQ